MDRLKKAAEAHARKILGDDQFENNPDARGSIILDFVEGANFANTWIKVSDELPERGGRCLCLESPNEIFPVIRIYDAHNKIFYEEDEGDKCEVTKWLPFPSVS